MIIMEKDADSLKEILQEKGKSAVRFELAGFGWGGPEFGIVLDEQRENDTVIEEYGIKFVIDKEFDFLIGELKVISTPQGFTVYGDGSCGNN